MMLTDEQLEDLATLHIAPQMGANDTLDLMPLLRAVEAAAGTAARQACADELSINRAEALLHCGEMSASEWRTVAAVLRWLQTRMRSNVAGNRLAEGKSG